MDDAVSVGDVDGGGSKPEVLGIPGTLGDQTRKTQAEEWAVN